MGKKIAFPRPDERLPALTRRRNLKMARSAHAYVRGSTVRFYEWLDARPEGALPEGPPIWICGDCHIGNLGPVASAEGKVEIQIRDLDQTVIGNPVHDLIRLSLSLAMAARGSDLPGVVTARMVEEVARGYSEGLAGDTSEPLQEPESVRVVRKRALRRTWKHLARERIEDITPTIPLGKTFWSLSRDETHAIRGLLDEEAAHALITALKGRDEQDPITVLDAAWWLKGCSSLGRMRYAVLVGVGEDHSEGGLCLLDIKEAVKAAAPRARGVNAPRDNAVRVVEGARALAPHLGERMLAARLLDRPVVVRELMPQDLKLEIDELTTEEAVLAARFLARVVGKAHGRQMAPETRTAWLKDLTRNPERNVEAPSWLWTGVVDLVAVHEAAYLEHCRRFAMETLAA